MLRWKILFQNSNANKGEKVSESVVVIENEIAANTEKDCYE